MLPLGTSAVIVGFGFLITLDAAAAGPAHVACCSSPSPTRWWRCRSWCARSRPSSGPSTRGCGRRRPCWARHRVARGRRSTGRIVARAALVGAAFAFAVSLGEFGATLFIARPDTPTLPIAIDRLLGLPGAVNFAQAMAMSTVLMVLTAVAVLLIERLRGPGPSPF